MMIFRTELKNWEAGLTLSHDNAIVCMGSCFAEHMGARLQERKFQTLLNPAGIVYNPVSLAATLEWMASGRRFSDADVFEWNGQWNSFHHHSRYSALSREALLNAINAAMAEASLFFEKTSRLLLTLGTALVYEHREMGGVVANCHKLPAAAFTRRRLSVEEVTVCLAPVLSLWKERLPALEVIISVSPVRHLREGMIDNQRSKATLVLAAAQLSDQLPFVHYFPAYELLLDDLRDYRFYAEDLLHPSAQAVEYIWEFFSRHYFSDPTRRLIAEIEDVLRAARHRPFQPDSAAHQAFRQKQLDRIAALEKALPLSDWREEKEVYGVK
ncbi:MAG: GSCFA domain-containing protein [Saprospiraceae bacterium]